MVKFYYSRNSGNKVMIMKEYVNENINELILKQIILIFIICNINFNYFFIN